MSFQKTVLVTASIILIISLIVIALILKIAKSNTKYPPEIGVCPDYFLPKSGNVCSNPKGLGKNLGDEVTFNGDMACGGDCNKNNLLARCRWSKENGVQWDGITNTNMC
jgi:hypothetical protein|uniref:CPW-WPC domain-containing protein n=1 Tax=viral metagenome TaxID=1070528 RepID=A0A6C0BZF5_9ZZZZ